jgi:hypothetical protein
MVMVTFLSPRIVEGVSFEYRRADPLYEEWYALDNRLLIRNNLHKQTYSAYFDKEPLGHRYRSLEAAMRATVIRSRDLSAS